MRSAVRIMDQVLARVLAMLLAVMVLNVTWQVLGRLLLGVSTPWTEELSRFAMIWVALLGTAYGVGRGSHLALDLLPNSLHGVGRKILEQVIYQIVLVFSLVVFVGGGVRLVWVSLQLGQISAALHWKLGYVYLVVPVTGALIIFYCLAGLMEAQLQGGTLSTKSADSGARGGER